MSVELKQRSKPAAFAQRAGRKPIYLLCYDIREPKRLKRIQRHISKYGLAIQYSMYLFVTKRAALKTLSWLKKNIEEDDDVRVYQVRSSESLWLYGRKQNATPAAEETAQGLWQWFSGLLK